MNKCYLVGKILEISDYKFFYNSKKHNSMISFLILTSDSNIRKGNVFKVYMYDDVADFAYRNCNINDIIFMIGKIGEHMKIEILRIEII